MSPDDVEFHMGGFRYAEALPPEVKMEILDLMKSRDIDIRLQSPFAASVAADRVFGTEEAKRELAAVGKHLRAQGIVFD